jgi:hypothetical protein
MGFSRQYWKLIFYHNEEQKEAAIASKEHVQRKIGADIPAQILPYSDFYIAEDYHQKYSFRGNPRISGFFEDVSDTEIRESELIARLNAYSSRKLTAEQVFTNLRHPDEFDESIVNAVKEYMGVETTPTE